MDNRSSKVLGIASKISKILGIAFVLNFDFPIPKILGTIPQSFLSSHAIVNYLFLCFWLQR